LDSFVGILAFILGGTVLLMIVIGIIVTGISRHFNRINCEQFSQQTNRPTKFVLYNFASTGLV
jgi:hypothetical protein